MQVRRLGTRLRFHGWVLGAIEKDLDEDDRPYVDCLEGVRFLLQLSDLIRCVPIDPLLVKTNRLLKTRDILADISLSSATIVSSLSYRLQSLLCPLLNTSTCAGNPDPTLSPPQKHLKELYETALKCISSLTLSLTNLTNRLSKFAVTLVPEIADSVAVGCFKSITCGNDYTPKASFRVAGESACRLMGLFIKLTVEHEEREWMGWYVSKIFILLRVVESYFNSPQLKHQRGIFGNPGQWNGCRGVPTVGVGVFDMREIGGILAGVLGAEIVLKVGATKPGIAVDFLVEKRVGALRRCLVIAWQREVKSVEKAKWLGGSRRVVMVELGSAGREEKDVVAPIDGSGTAPEALDWGAQAAECTFQTSRTGKEPPVIRWMLEEPADGALVREEVGLETGESPVSGDDSRATAPDNLEIRAARKAFQTPKKEKKPAKEAVKGEIATEALQGEPAKIEMDAGGEKGKKKGYKGKYGEMEEGTK